MDKIVSFTNITDEDFTYPLDGQMKTFKAGKTVPLVVGVANHFAKHLANKILTEKGEHSKCSPDKPEDVPEFINLVHQMISDPEAEDEEEDVEEVKVEKKKTTKKKVNDDDEFEGLKKD